MSRRIGAIILSVAVGLGGLPWFAPPAVADEPIFSGPQVGERLVAFAARGALGESAGEELDLVSAADGGPLLIVFVHESTRPSIALMRTVIEFAKRPEQEGLRSGVVFLTDNPTETEAFLKRAAHAMPRGVPLGISLDGQEGPGAYGLNRNVTLTVLVAKENRVTANFALRQPSLPQDGPEIAHAIIKVLGGDKKPTLAEMGVERGAMVRDRAGEAADDARFRAILSPVIRKDATVEEVDEAARKVEAYAAEDDVFKKRVASTARRIIDAGRLENYGTAAAQKYLAKWAKEFSSTDDEAEEPSRNKDEE